MGCVKRDDDAINMIKRNNYLITIIRKLKIPFFKLQRTADYDILEWQGRKKKDFSLHIVLDIFVIYINVNIFLLAMMKM